MALWIVFHDWSAVIMLAIPALRSTSYLPTERRPRAQRVPILQGLKRASRVTDPPKEKPRGQEAGPWEVYRAWEPDEARPAHLPAGGRR